MLQTRGPRPLQLRQLLAAASAPACGSKGMQLSGVVLFEAAPASTAMSSGLAASLLLHGLRPSAAFTRGATRCTSDAVSQGLHGLRAEVPGAVLLSPLWRLGARMVMPVDMRHTTGEVGRHLLLTKPLRILNAGGNTLWRRRCAGHLSNNFKNEENSERSRRSEPS